MDLGPTKGCLAAIDCLEAHCKLLRGSTSKEVLEVFYQEVGLRLIGQVLFDLCYSKLTCLEFFKNILNAKSFHFKEGFKLLQI